MIRFDAPRLVRSTIALSLVSVFGACDSFKPVYVDALNMDPDSVFVEPGGSAQISAIPLDPNGIELPDRRERVEFTVPGNAAAIFSAQPSTGTITVTGVGLGSSSVVGRLGRGAAQSAVHVVPAGLAFVGITESRIDIQRGQTVRVEAILEDAQGNPLSIEGHRVSWATSDPLIASVYIINRDLPFTTVTGRRQGTTSLLLIVSGRTVSIPVTIS